MIRLRFAIASVVAALFVSACTHHAAAADDHAGHETSPAASAAVSSGARDSMQQAANLPAGEADAKARLAKSPRHGEYVMVKVGSDSVRAWVVYPQVSTKAPVVVVVHEIFGLSSWIRSVADQLAADGFIAIAPDLLTGKIAPTLDDSTLKAQAPALIQTLDPAIVQRDLDAVAQYAMALPAAEKKYGIVGFCWGGGVSFAHDAHAGTSPELGASVVYYGVPPKPDQLPNVHAPVLGLYGGTDARIALTVPGTDSALKSLGRTYEHTIFPGAAHGFLRAQTQTDGSIMQANADATRQAWPATIAWFKKYLK
ncbi:MAG TPA: dienelactone hydrolase family protein [Gemmatimonadaceae bacterium]|jgi:carboxymethylenebutenolidase|nr:dienelactone hydrolase family protein [Gemmatimonadaceae bacterium]